MCDIENLVMVAKRDNNTKRPYLYVNPSQGKHIPVEPSVPLGLFKKMAQMLDEYYPSEKLLIIGFAETATAIGAAVSYFSENVLFCSQTTRERYEGKEYLHFSESHSHATEQGLIVDGYEEILSQIDRIIFVEDEVTTGNTICKLIDAIKNRFDLDNMQFGIISILNSMSDERINELNNQGVSCQYVKKIPFEYHIEEIDNYQYDTEELDYTSNIINNKSVKISFVQSDLSNLRFLVSKKQYSDSVMQYLDEIMQGVNLTNVRKVLVLGTEEYMFVPMLLASMIKEKNPNIQVRNHATTRSPIMVSKDAKYPLNNRVILKSCYEKTRTTYLYNLDNYDLCIVLSDSTGELEAYNDILCAINKFSCCRFMIAGKEQV